MERDSEGELRERVNNKRARLTYDAVIDAFEMTEAEMRDVALESGTYLIDAAMFTGRTEMFLTNIHLNDSGADIFADYVAGQIAPILMADMRK